MDRALEHESDIAKPLGLTRVPGPLAVPSNSPRAFRNGLSRLAFGAELSPTNPDEYL